MSSRLLALFALLAMLSCGDDGGGADVDAAPAIDSAPRCILAPEPVNCSGDPECAAICAGAYCREFGMLGELFCTNDCTSGNDCADGWSCNMMGRCRPPGITDLTGS